jgi:hypothetical protein
MPDTPILQSQRITITNTLARFGDVSFPIASIGSVKVIESPKEMTGAFVLVFVSLAAVFVLIAIADAQFSILAFAALIAATGCCYALYDLLSSDRSRYILILRTSGGDQQALITNNRDEILLVKSAIEEAAASPK